MVKTMDFKLIGGILLIVGTSIGAGMLGLPIATARLGFPGAMILLFVCWFVMTSGALLILEINLWLPTNSNLISMAKATIGPIGQIVAWLTYLLLLYSLLCAYIAGGSGLFHSLLISAGIHTPRWVSSILFTILFGLIVYQGIRAVDYVNRGLMSVKFAAFFILVILLLPYITYASLSEGSMAYILGASALTVTITSFGFATIVPSLRIYFGSDVHKLRKAIIFGSLIPLICYILWDLSIMGVLPLEGKNGLISILNSDNSTSDFVNALTAVTSGSGIHVFVKLFTSICVLTSFLGVSLCLTDFFADGLSLEKKGFNTLLVCAITFIPPLLVVIFFPNFFIKGLEYAGIYSIILLILLPSWMAFTGRYRKKIAKGYQVFGGKALLIFLMLFSIFAIVKGTLT